MVFSPLSDKNSLFQLVNYIATSDVNIFRVVTIFSHRRLCRSEFIQATRDSNISQFYKKKNWYLTLTKLKFVTTSIERNAIDLTASA